MSEQTTVGELGSRHIARRIVLSQDGDTHKISGQAVKLVEVAHIAGHTCVVWLCERADRHPGFLGIEGEHEHDEWFAPDVAVEVLDA